MNMLETAITQVDQQGIGVDMNLGTSLPFGGPQITPEPAGWSWNPVKSPLAHPDRR